MSQKETLAINSVVSMNMGLYNRTFEELEIGFKDFCQSLVRSKSLNTYFRSSW